MRVYANLIHQNLALFDLPGTKYDQISIFRRLLIYDQLPDDDFENVLREAGQMSVSPDPAFNILFGNDFEKYISLNRHQGRWDKIQKDYNYYTEWEIRRRNKENPYIPESPSRINTWNELPNLTKEKKNRPYFFDPLYREAQTLSGMVYELTKNYAEFKDKDLFRAKVNSLLVPNKIILAMNSKDNPEDFEKSEITTVNIKISLDAYKLASVFVQRLEDSLHKMKWSYQQALDPIDMALALTNRVKARLQERIYALERNFILYLEADSSEE